MEADPIRTSAAAEKYELHVTNVQPGSIDWRVANLEATIASLKVNFDLIQRDHVSLNHILDTINTSLWRRLLYRLDGWPPWWDEGKQGRRWRPWHRFGIGYRTAR
jgi:hypothetical protein